MTAQAICANGRTEMPKGEPDFARQIETLTKIATHPVMLDVLKEIEQAPADRKFEIAGRLASREALEKRGLRLPDDGRVSLREFEDRSQRTVIRENVLAAPIQAEAADGGTGDGGTGDGGRGDGGTGDGGTGDR